MESKVVGNYLVYRDAECMGGSVFSKDKKWFRAENNLVNRIILGIESSPQTPTVKLRYSGKLEEFQRLDVKKTLQQKNVLNANSMGLGKTVESIKALREMDAQSVAIIVPKSIMNQWADQIGVWWPDAHSRVDILPDKVEKGRIVIYNYDKLIRAEHLYKFKNFQLDVLICDEAHRIKSPRSGRTNAVKSIPAKYRWALTGTPILNKPDDLWSILHFVNPDYVGKSYQAFKEYFCELEEGFFGIENKGLTTNVYKQYILHELGRHVIIRNPGVRTAFGKTYETVRVDMSSKQLTLYKKIKKVLLDELPEDLSIPNAAVLTLRLRQATSCPHILDENTGMGAKFEWIAEKISDNPEEKFVVFTCFEQVAVRLSKYLKVKSLLYTGKQKPAIRAQALSLFQQPRWNVMIGTIGAMGEGVDGLQEKCRNVIFIDKDWSPEVVRQAEDRLNRKGQKDVVQIYSLECKNSFDQYVGKVNFTKSSDIRRALNES